jgi:ABC-type transport system involved in multi-copper enzyme maturation permease subunit
MTAGAISDFSDLFDPIRLVGPIFDKELRVSARRRRNYLLRFAYVIVLSFFVLSAWYSYTGGNSPGGLVYRMSRLSTAARQSISTIVWFQFVTAQLLAIIMLGSSISDEIRSGTLGVLMTTPINSFQIVTGKLLSKLLQVMLLLAISLPFLAIVRVFGGVPWDYVASSVCITLTATLLAGSLSLLLSITYRHGYTVILVTIGIYMLLFGAMSGLLNMLAAEGWFFLNRQGTQSLLAMTNPFFALAALNAKFLQTGALNFPWPLHSLIMLAVTAVLIAVAVWRIRKAAPIGTSGTTKEFRSISVLERILTRIFYKAGSRHGAAMTVTDSPIIWKEMHKGFIGRSNGEAAMFILLVGAFLIAAVLQLLSSPGNRFLPHYFLTAFYFIVMVRLALFSASSITAEKEARTWPVLLATPLDDKDIVRGKAIAAFRRNVPLLLMYVVLSSLLYLPHTGVLKAMLPVIVTVIPSLLSSVLFIVGSGLYFATRFRATAGAVAATVGLYFAITWLFCGWFNPLNRFFFMRLMSRGGGQWLYFLVSIIRCLIVALVGLSLARCARRRLRRDIF